MSAFNIEVQSGASVRLPTAGKYCDRDIVVQATGGSTKNKLAKLVDGSITEITEEDLAGATKVCDYAFYWCRELTSIELPNSVLTLGNYSFYGCTKLTGIVIPESITAIYAYAFMLCNGLKTVIMKPTTPPNLRSSTIFEACSALEEIIVPNGCADAYKSATNWSEYADIIKEETV